MVLGIDASQANRKIRSGTEWYAFHLIEGFKSLLADRSDVKVRLYLRDLPQPDLANNLPENFEFKVLRWPFPHFWGQLRLSWEMLRNPPDILFCPAHTISLIGGGKTFTTLHDIGFEDNPELYDKLSLWYHRWSAKRAVKRAYHIFTVSEFSKHRIVEIYKCPPNKITVTHLGIDALFSAEKSGATLNKYGLGENEYILFIGRLEPKKNILGMVKAHEHFLSFSRRRESSLDAGSKSGMTDVPDLVLAGRKIRTRDIDDYLKGKPELASKIKFLGYVDEKQKQALYAGAKLFLFPTLYEGFGIPILEAQSYGIPVITSNTTSNPEVAGEGALIVDPRNIQEIAAAIQNLMSDDSLRREKIRLGLENVKRFNWEETAKKTLDKILATSPQPSPKASTLSPSPLAGEGGHRPDEGYRGSTSPASGTLPTCLAGRRAPGEGEKEASHFAKRKKR